jgi:hypothetical protein
VDGANVADGVDGGEGATVRRQARVDVEAVGAVEDRAGAVEDGGAGVPDRGGEVARGAQGSRNALDRRRPGVGVIFARPRREEREVAARTAARGGGVRPV